MFRFLLLVVAALALAGCGFGDINDADGTPPAILITKPAGTSVQGVVDFAAAVIDNVGVQVVEFYVDDELLYTDFTEPYETRWDTLGRADRTVVLKVQARDLSGNQSLTSKEVTVANSPN